MTDVLFELYARSSTQRALHEKKFIATWCISDTTVCATCGTPAREGPDPEVSEWHCQACNVTTFSMKPAFKNK